jgi:hypothetical protein
MRRRTDAFKPASARPQPHGPPSPAVPLLPFFLSAARAAGGFAESVWGILDNASPAERRRLEPIKATSQYARVVEAGIPADALDVSLLWAIRAIPFSVPSRDLKRAARRLREAAEALEPLAALPRTFWAHDKTSDELRIFGLSPVLGNPSRLKNYLLRRAARYDYVADRLGPSKRGRPADFARWSFQMILDEVAKHVVGDPLIPLLTELHKVAFHDSAIDVDTYRRELKRLRPRLAGSKKG